jgi:hypothetical protein
MYSTTLKTKTKMESHAKTEDSKKDNIDKTLHLINTGKGYCRRPTTLVRWEVEGAIWQVEVFDALMAATVTGIGEGFLTVVAEVHASPGVGSLVAGQVAAAVESLTAH